MSFLFNNVNDAFCLMWQYFMHEPRLAGVFERNSRNGRVLEFQDPATLIYLNSRRRVLFHPVRDANPFFHLFEAIWMLAGRNDVTWLSKFNKQMLEYSDDGKTLVSAYGLRLWENGLHQAIEKLRKDHDTRRAYVPIFIPEDSDLTGKDIPCNVGVSFLIRDEKLDLAVFNRSNDMIWGALGANYVTFSFIQEYVAALCAVDVGTYTQISSCFHMYPDFDVAKKLVGKVDPAPFDPYETSVAVSPIRILSNRSDMMWKDDVKYFMDDYTYGNTCEQKSHWFKEPFFEHVAAPMFRAWHHWRCYKTFDTALQHMEHVGAPDWRMAGKLWLDRRQHAHTNHTPEQETI